MRKFTCRRFLNWLINGKKSKYQLNIEKEARRKQRIVLEKQFEDPDHDTEVIVEKILDLIKQDKSTLNSCPVAAALLTQVIALREESIYEISTKDPMAGQKAFREVWKMLETQI